MTSTSRRHKCGIIWLRHNYVRQWTKARSGGATMGCLASEFHLGEALAQRVSLAVGSGFGSSDFTISHLAMHPTPGQEKHKLQHLHTCNSASCFPCPTSWGLCRDLEEPHQLNVFGCSPRLCYLLLQNLKSSVNSAVKSRGFIIDSHQIQGCECAMGKAHGPVPCCMLGHILP